MQNFRTKARASSGIFSGKKVAACMLSVAVAAVIFWGITLTGNTEHSDEQMTVAQALRAAGDTLSANADPTKFTGGISSRVKMMELEEQGQAPSDDPVLTECVETSPVMTYEERVQTLIREQYSIADELAILRQRDTKPDEFAAYFEYAEQCKTQAEKQMQL